MLINIKDQGVYVKVSNLYIKRNGLIVGLDQAYIKQDGVWVHYEGLGSITYTTFAWVEGLTWT
jgi:hypothetical protein